VDPAGAAEVGHGGGRGAVREDPVRTHARELRHRPPRATWRRARRVR
jgi:hypothetical protein